VNLRVITVADGLKNSSHKQQMVVMVSSMVFSRFGRLGDLPTGEDTHCVDRAQRRAHYSGLFAQDPVGNTSHMHTKIR
jgi:hypothetical protein